MQSPYCLNREPGCSHQSSALQGEFRQRLDLNGSTIRATMGQPGSNISVNLYRGHRSQGEKKGRATCGLEGWECTSCTFSCMRSRCSTALAYLINQFLPNRNRKLMSRVRVSTVGDISENMLGGEECPLLAELTLRFQHPFLPRCKQNKQNPPKQNTLLLQHVSITARAGRNERRRGDRVMQGTLVRAPRLLAALEWWEMTLLVIAKVLNVFTLDTFTHKLSLCGIFEMGICILCKAPEAVREPLTAAVSTCQQYYGCPPHQGPECIITALTVKNLRERTLSVKGRQQFLQH